MAKNTKTIIAPVPSKNKFAASLLALGHRFSLSRVFDDFLTMTMAACTINPQTTLSHYEEEYLATIDYYKASELRHEFPKAFAALIHEMEERTGTSDGNDVLGEFFEQHISNGNNGQFFTPYPICMFMASITNTDICFDDDSNSSSLRILDPACGSGRMLLAAHRIKGNGHEYYGIDIDRTCVKITALNLFLNGMWHSEVMCANALAPDDFVIAYRISLLPLGIFKIEQKEASKLWQLHKNSFPTREPNQTGASINLNPTPFHERPKDNGTQLILF